MGRAAQAHHALAQWQQGVISIWVFRMGLASAGSVNSCGDHDGVEVQSHIVTGLMITK